MTQTGEASWVFSPQRLKPGDCDAVYGTAKQAAEKPRKADSSAAEAASE